MLLVEDNRQEQPLNIEPGRDASRPPHPRQLRISFPAAGLALSDDLQPVGLPPRTESLDEYPPSGAPPPSASATSTLAPSVLARGGWLVGERERGERRAGEMLWRVPSDVSWYSSRGGLISTATQGRARRDSPLERAQAERAKGDAELLGLAARELRAGSSLLNDSARTGGGGGGLSSYEGDAELLGLAAHPGPTTSAALP